MYTVKIKPIKNTFSQNTEPQVTDMFSRNTKNVINGINVVCKQYIQLIEKLWDARDFLTLAFSTAFCNSSSFCCSSCICDSTNSRQDCIQSTVTKSPGGSG